MIKMLQIIDWASSPDACLGMCKDNDFFDNDHSFLTINNYGRPVVGRP